jgi:cubilin
MSSEPQTWTSSSGSVERMNYEVNEDMTGIIAPTGASFITLRFTYFDAELGYDFVTVKSCTAIDCAETSVLGEFTGSTIPGPLTSNTGILLIAWWSDEIITRTGWAANWSSGMPVGLAWSGFRP